MTEEQKLTGIIDDLKEAREEGFAALQRLPQPRLPEADAPPHWFRHLYDAEGRVV